MILSKNNQQRNKNNKKKNQEREEYGYGYEISVNDLNRIGQNDAAKTNTKTRANHPISLDKK